MLIHEITFDARDPHVLAAFWAALLEREIRPGDMPQGDSVLVVPTPGQLGLLFPRVPARSIVPLTPHRHGPRKTRSTPP